MHTITIRLTEAAQRAAVLARVDARREQFFEVTTADLPALLSLPRASVDADGAVQYHALGSPHPGPEGGGTYNGLYSLTLDERPRDGAHAISLVQAALDARRQAAEAKAAAEAAEQAERERAEAAEVARLEVKLADAPLAAHVLGYSDEFLARIATEGYAVAHNRELAAGVEQRNYGWRLPALDGRVRTLAGLELARRASERAVKAELAERRLRKLAAIVREHGDETARGRLDADLRPLGLLPEAEALQIATDARLPVKTMGSLDKLDELLTPFVPLDADDVEPHCAEDCHAVDPSYLAETTETLTADEWTAVQATRRALKAAGLPEGALKRHKGQCDHRDCPAWPVSRIGIEVELDLGDGLIVKREYGV